MDPLEDDWFNYTFVPEPTSWRWWSLVPTLCSFDRYSNETCSTCSPACDTLLPFDDTVDLDFVCPLRSLTADWIEKNQINLWIHKKTIINK